MLPVWYFSLSRFSSVRSLQTLYLFVIGLPTWSHSVTSYTRLLLHLDVVDLIRFFQVNN